MANQPEDLASFIAMARVKDYLILDTETTGLRRPASIWELSITDKNGIALFNSKIRPIHCPDHPSFNNPEMTRDDLKDCPTWADVNEGIKTIICDRDVVVYNATFDRNMFHLSDEDGALPAFPWSAHARWWCCMLAYAEYNGEWDSWHGNWAWKKLSAAAAHCQIDQEGAHRALVDCRTTGEIIRVMLRELADLSIEDITHRND